MHGDSPWWIQSSHPIACCNKRRRRVQQTTPEAKFHPASVAAGEVAVEGSESLGWASGSGVNDPNKVDPFKMLHPSLLKEKPLGATLL